MHHLKSMRSGEGDRGSLLSNAFLSFGILRRATISPNAAAAADRTCGFGSAKPFSASFRPLESLRGKPNTWVALARSATLLPSHAVWRVCQASSFGFLGRAEEVVGGFAALSAGYSYWFCNSIDHRA